MEPIRAIVKEEPVATHKNAIPTHYREHLHKHTAVTSSETQASSADAGDSDGVTDTNKAPDAELGNSAAEQGKK